MPSTSITVTGNITQDPKLKYTANGSALLSFSVAANYSWKNQSDEWEKKTSYFDVTAWRDLAEDAANVLLKGVGVTVTGRLEQRSWDDEESGQKRSKVEIIADQIAVNVRSIDSFVRRKSDADGGGKQKSFASAKAAAKPASSREDEPF
jgi:single-strand DNA-binding protein